MCITDQNTITNRRNDWVDYAKGIGILLVVYGHVLSGIKNNGLDISPIFFYYSDNLVYSFHMPLFFFLSGLFVVHSFIKTMRITPFVLGKIKVIAYPYFIWSFIQVSIQILMSSYTNDVKEISDLIYIFYKPQEQFWFLYVLFFLSVLYAILYALLRNVYLILLISIIVYFSKFGIPIFTKNFIFFSAGAALSSYMLSLIPSKSITYSFIVFWIIFALIHGTLGFLQFYGLPGLSLPLAIFGILLTCYLANYLATKHLLRFLKYMGYVSLPIYVAHVLSGSGTRIILSKLLNIHHVGVHLFLGTFFGIVFPIILYEFGRRMGFPYLFALRK
jgi:fucose 4-O-acetylase-like acetyltransferase